MGFTKTKLDWLQGRREPTEDEKRLTSQDLKLLDAIRGAGEAGLIVRGNGAISVRRWKLDRLGHIRVDLATHRCWVGEST